MHKVSVSRARKIVTKLLNEVRNDRSSLQGKLPFYVSNKDEARSLINDLMVQKQNTVLESVQCVELVYALRERIGALNNKEMEGVSVNALLTERNKLDMTLSVYQNVAYKNGKSVDEIVRMHMDERERKDSYGSNRTEFQALGLSFLSDIAEKVTLIHRRLVEIEDQLASLNASSKVSLTDEEHTFLTDKGLL